MDRLRTMVVKEFQQLRRDRRTMMMFTMSPVLQLIVVGYAVSNDVRHVPTGVYDGDRSQRSRALVRAIQVGDQFVVRYAASPRDLPRMLDRREAEVTLEIPAGFSRRLLRGETAPLQVLVDGSDSTSATLAAQYLGALLQASSANLAVEARRLARAPAARGVDLQPRVWFNPQLLSLHFMVPAVLALVLAVTTTIATSLSIVREREVGTLEQLVVTPLKSWELLAGKMIPPALLALADAALILLVIRYWFRVPMLGSPALVMLCVVGLMLNTLGTGLMISTISRTQQQAQLTAFLLINPAILLSGFIFPIANMPRLIQPFTWLIAARHFLEAERGVFLRGFGLADILPQLGALLLLGGLTFLLGVLRFRKQLD
ncbi:MAG: ABC transporter permease [Armatimonadetes bacterium]|nr:ABC transporter permease [Armatimonadota bacterium]